MSNGMYSWWHHCVLDSFIPYLSDLRRISFITGRLLANITVKTEVLPLPK